MLIQNPYIRSLMYWIVSMLAIIAFPAVLYAEKTTDVNTGCEPGEGCEALGRNVEGECSAIKGSPMHGESVVSSVDEINTA